MALKWPIRKRQQTRAWRLGAASDRTLCSLFGGGHRCAFPHAHDQPCPLWTSSRQGLSGDVVVRKPTITLLQVSNHTQQFGTLSARAGRLLATDASDVIAGLAGDLHAVDGQVEYALLGYNLKMWPRTIKPMKIGYTLFDHLFWPHKCFYSSIAPHDSC